MKNIIIFSFFMFLVSCSTDDEYVVNFPESVFIEFNWCSYASNKSPDELGAIFIDYRNFLESNSFNASYLNPLFKTDTYDFIMMEFFKNKESSVDPSFSFIWFFLKGSNSIFIALKDAKPFFGLNTCHCCDFVVIFMELF